MQVALSKGRTMGFIDKSNVYGAGCYVLGPDATLLYFDATVQFVDMNNISIFTSDKLEITIDTAFQYYIR